MITVLALLTSFAALVLAENNAPLGAETVTVIRTENSNLSLYAPATVNAEAGNLTELTITGVSQTKTWQGYYGNVSGTIILEDAQGNRFYDWGAAEPKGEIYASVNATVTWTDVACADLTNSAYITDWNSFYGITDNDYDSLNTTYNLSDHPTFYVGTRTQTGCPTTYTFVNDARQEGDFPAVLLTSNTNGTMIFTSVLENKSVGQRTGVPGFDGGNYDFQLLVAENGQAGNDAITLYYFWVELE
jgi:hypothetical protein